MEKNNNNKKNDKKKINPQFNNLENPKAYKKHLEDLKKVEDIAHEALLNKLLQQIEPVDFESIANPNANEDFKLSIKHYTVISIDKIISIAKKNKWGLCKHNNLTYLFNGTHWVEISKETFQKFLGDAALKMKVPVYSAKYFRFKKELYEQFMATAYLDIKEADVNKVLINLENGTFEINKVSTKLRHLIGMIF